MKKNKTIYLHIGMPKAGSTSLQLFCRNNYEKLKENGILYPCNENANSQINASFINYREIIFNVYQAELKKDLKSYNEFFKETFLPVLNNTECDKIIFSEEGIWKNDVSPEICDIMLEYGFDVKVIAYIRRPVEYLASFWQEHLKPFYFDLSFHPKLEEFLDNYSPNYEIIDKYAKKLGKENIILRPFESEQWKNGDIYEDFLDIFALDMFSDAIIQRTNENPFNRDTAEFMQFLRTPNMSQKQFTRYIYEYALSLAPEEEAENLDPKNREQSLKIIEKYQPKSLKIIDSVSDEKIIQITQKYKSVMDKFAKYIGRETFYINPFPKSFNSPEKKKINSGYNGFLPGLEQVAILLEAFIKRKPKYEYRGLETEYEAMVSDVDDIADFDEAQPAQISNEHLETLYRAVNNAKENYDKLNEENKNISLELDTSIKEGEKLNEALNQQIQQVQVLSQELEAERNRTDNLQNNLNQLDKKKDSLEHALFEEKGRNNQLSDILSQNMSKIEDLSGQIQKETANSDNLQKELNKAQVSANEMKNSLSEAQKTNKNLENEITRLQTSLEDNKNELKIEKQENKILSGQIEKLNSSLDKNKNELSKQKDTNRDLTNEVSYLKNSLNENKNELTKQTKANQKLNKQIGELQSSFEYTKNELKSEKEKNKTLNKKINELHTSLVNKTNELSASRENGRELRKTIEDMNVKINSLSLELKMYKMPFYQKIFSARNFGDKKVFTVLGIRIGLPKRNRK